MTRPSISNAIGRKRTAIGRRQLFRQGGAVALGAAVMPRLITSGGKPASVGDPSVPAGRGLLFQTKFHGQSLDSRYWNPYITDDPANGWPWSMQTDVAVPSSAIGGPNQNQADYDLPSFVVVDDGLRLRAELGTAASGYSWTGAVINSRPTDNDFGSGTIHTQGVVFSGGYVEVTAKMPSALDQGMWPAIWFLAAPPASGDEEIDLFEGGMLLGSTDPSRVFSSTMPSHGNVQFKVDTGVDLSADYHRYGLEYRPGELINTYFDDQLVANFTPGNAGYIPANSYFMILNLSVATSLTSGWHSQLTPATTGPFEMLVSRVQMWSHRPAGQG